VQGCILAIGLTCVAVNLLTNLVYSASQPEDPAIMIWTRYVPGLAAATVGAALLYGSRRQRSVRVAILATLWGLVCMEAEYWVAHGFPWSEISFFTAAVVLTLTALVFGALGGAALGIMGLAFFGYVNLRYYAPYLLDYVQPVLYAVLLARSRHRLDWQGKGILRAGWMEGLWIAATCLLAVWRTSTFGKWGWLTGGPW
jgi:hypothetical protein